MKILKKKIEIIHKNKLKIIITLLILFAIFLFSCSKKSENQIISTNSNTLLEETKIEETNKQNIINDGQINILYTNDVECAIKDNIGYSSLAEYKKQMKSLCNYTLLVDSGDFLMGNNLSSMSNGKDIISIMNKVGYDFVNVGMHDFNYGVENLIQRNKELNCKMFSSNFITINNNKTVFSPYKIFKCGEYKIALIGITSPTALYTSDEKLFQNEENKPLYSFCEDFSGNKLYEKIQENIDKALKEGANKIILVGHCGNLNVDTKYSSKQIIAHTTNVCAFIDGNSEEEIAEEIVKNKNNEDVILTQTGSKLKNIGQLTIYNDDSIKTQLIKQVNMPDGTSCEEDIREGEVRKKGFNLSGNYENEEVTTFINNLYHNFKINSKKTFFNSTFPYIYNDKEHNILIRKKETNLGDLIADSIKYKLNTDVAIITASSIRNGIEKGSVPYETIFKIYPFNNRLYSIEATGEQIKEALELSIKNYPNESGDFLQIAGISFDINIKATKSNATVENKIPVISNININGEKIDLKRKYSVGLLNSIIKNNFTPYTMFKKCKILKENVCTDVDALLQYINDNPNLDIYKNPNGNWRININ